MKNITVEHAINRFWIFVMLPSIFGLIGLPVISIYIGVYHDVIINWVIPLGIISGILFAYFNWTIGLYKWHVWAYYHVVSVYELDKAIDIYHIVYWGDWKEKLQKNNPEKYNIIQRRINEPVKFEDDFNVANETFISYSITLSVVYLTLCLSGMSLAILSLTDKRYAQGIAFMLIALGFTIWQLTISLNRKPKIILSNEGVTTVSLGFTKWQDISNEEVKLNSRAKNRWYYLTYNTPNGDERLKINNLATSPARLNHLLIVYRNRNKFHQPG